MADRALARLRRHRVPAWWRDAKLGIFIHWTPASVPAYAPVDVDIGELVQSGRRDALAGVPYTEWYENSLRFPDSPVARHHRAVYGTRPYTSFAADWEAGLEQWDPDAWAARGPVRRGRPRTPFDTGFETGGPRQRGDRPLEVRGDRLQVGECVVVAEQPPAEMTVVAHHSDPQRLAAG